MVASGEAFHALLWGEAAGSLIDRSDDEVEAAVLPEVERYFPGVTEAKRFAHIVRWHEAEPKSPVGRSRAIAEYRRRGAARRVWLAGTTWGCPGPMRPPKRMCRRPTESSQDELCEEETRSRSTRWCP